MKITSLSLSVLALGGLLALNACKKDADPEPDTNAGDAEAAQEIAIAEQLFGDMKNIADEAESGSVSSFKNGMSFASCATVTLNQAQKQITVDFGTSNCLCRDLRNRRGVLNVTYTTNYWDSGNVVTITPQNYYVNDYGITGTKTLTNLGNDANGNPHWSVAVSGQITKPNNGGTFSWTSSRVNTWSAGSSTPQDWTDDAWTVTGSSTLTSSSQIQWTLNITKALHRAMNCPWIDEGTLTLDRTGVQTRTLDYGAGACDNDATLSVVGLSIPIKLK
ncbi:MAG: hypothetical protein EP332_15085 [Bacteroidetes bacterium]|nr:MAG: hypothetical protein EP332_15085 [Bacteroidota bacterium]